MKLNKIGAGEINIFSIGQFLPYVMYATPVLNEYLVHLSMRCMIYFLKEKM